MPEHSVQAKTFSYFIVIATRVTHRNTLLNDSDDWRFVLQTYLFLLSILLHFSVCSTSDVLDKMEETIR